MAFPTVVNAQTTAVDSNVTDMVISLPSSIVAGNLLVAVLAQDGAITSDWSGTGFTEFIDTNRTGVSFTAAWKIATGSEGSTITVVASATEQCVARVWQISGHNSSQAPEGATANNINLSPDPPNLAPTGGAKDYLWLVFAALQPGTNTASGFPTNYSNTGQEAGAAAAGQAPLAWGERQLNAASENPDAFTATTNSNWIAATIAIHPSTGVAQTISPNIAGMSV